MQKQSNTIAKISIEKVDTNLQDAYNILDINLTTTKNRTSYIVLSIL